MTEKQWLKERQKGIGGTDISVLMGVNPWRTITDVYNSKFNIETIRTNALMETGKILEDYIAKRYEKEYECKLTIPEKLITGEKSYFKASIDRFLDNDIIEIKTTATVFKDIPDNYYCQGQWYAGLTKAKRVIFVVLQLPATFNHREFVRRYNSTKRKAELLKSLDFTTELKTFEYVRDEKLIREMKQRAGEFWENHIELAVPPNETPETVYIEPIPSEESKEVNTDVYTNYLLIKDYREQMKELKSKLEPLELRLKAELKDTEIIKYKGNILATLKAGKREKFDKVKFELENPKLYDKYTEVIETRGSFLIK